jgi:hypothetical protein
MVAYETPSTESEEEPPGSSVLRISWETPVLARWFRIGRRAGIMSVHNLGVPKRIGRIAAFY